MSKDATATVYARMLADPVFRSVLSETLLSPWDLTEEEKHLLLEELTAGTTDPYKSRVMNHIRSGVVPLSPVVASALGYAINKANGLPTGMLTTRGFTSGSAGCCGWGHPILPMLQGMLE